ncbi:hypothetical protein [Streptomyces mirabilis]
MAAAKGLIKGLQRAVEPAKASGRPSIALTGTRRSSWWSRS